MHGCRTLIVEAPTPLNVRYCVAPSDNQIRHLAYLSPIFLCSRYSLYLKAAGASSRLSNSMMTVVGLTGSPSIATLRPRPRVRYLPPAASMIIPAFGEYSVWKASGLLTSIATTANAGG